MRTAKTILFAAALASVAATLPAHADAFAAGRAAYFRGRYVEAARLLGPLAERGNARAQTMLGIMYLTGQGVPQADEAAVYWHRLAAAQGDSTAQYFLGLMYDKGHGVPLDEVVAYMWLNLAAAGAPKDRREYYARVRDAVASKMTRGQIIAGQTLALEWAAHRGF